MTLFPRSATIQAMEMIVSTGKFVVVDGSPATGKTTILRELAVGTASKDEMAMLMLRAGGPGLFQSLANLFARSWSGICRQTTRGSGFAACPRDRRARSFSSPSTASSRAP
jgi:hypothetical protein